MSGRRDVLLATLGAEPQVITLVLDHLLARQETITQVVVLHTAYTLPDRPNPLDVLYDQWETHLPYRHITLQTAPIWSGGDILKDVTTPNQARAVLAALYHHVQTARQKYRRIHLCAAGGRKAMAMYAMLVAQVMFTDDDRLWLLVSKDTLRHERRAHARPGESSLLRMPVIPWRIEYATKQSALEMLTAAEREVMRFAAEGLSDGQIAKRLFKSPKTVGHQLSSVYDKLRVHFADRSNLEIDRHFLIAEFNAFFEIHNALTQHVQPRHPEHKG